MGAINDLTFNKILRKETRDIHSVSDALVNAKLAFALSDNDVWAEGLLVFYEIFRFLEKAMNTHKNTNLGKMSIEGMERTKAFEEDLKHYLGINWEKNYVVRESVADYISHLQILERANPDLLIAYVYHLYMGLLSGGQILRKKRQVSRCIYFLNKTSSDSSKGNAVTDFGELNIRELKREIINNLNSIAETLDENTKSEIIKESKMVFQLNNKIINSIHGANYIFLKKVLIALLITLVGFIVWKRFLIVY